MIKNNYILYFILFLVSSACNSEHDAEHKGIVKKQIGDISIDTLKADASNTSSMGRFFMHDSVLIFGDQLFSSLFIYDNKGNLLARKAGKGNGPEEIPGEAFFFRLKNNEKHFLAVNDNNMLFFINNTTWKIDIEGRLFFDATVDARRNHETLNPSYYKPYGRLKTSYKFSQISDSIILFPVMDRSQKLDPFNPNTARDFYNTVKTFGLVNMNTFEVEEVTGGYPGSFLHHKKWSSFANYTQAFKQDTMFVTHFPDSLIYVYKKPYQHPRDLEYTMGFNGKNMNHNYPFIGSNRNANDRKREQILKYGFYTNLHYVDESNILFRSYHKGSHTEYDGLQIYKGIDLIGDFEVPKYFKVLGYYQKFYYAVRFLPDAQQQVFEFYKFKIK